MRMGHRDSAPGPFGDTTGPFTDCVLGPSRTCTEPVDQWENEGGRLLPERPAGARKRTGTRGKTGRDAAPAGVPSGAGSGRMSALAGGPDLLACGRCHGPIQPARTTLLGRLVSCCIEVEQYHCTDPACGWSGLRRNPGAGIGSLAGRARSGSKSRFRTSGA